MIQQETVTFNGREFRRTYSDEGYLIRKVGTDEIYSEAVDLPDRNFEYVETDQSIEIEESD
jgi:hypothetical protein